MTAFQEERLCDILHIYDDKKTLYLLPEESSALTYGQMREISMKVYRWFFKENQMNSNRQKEELK